MLATLQKQHPHHSMMSSSQPTFLHHHRRNPSAPTLLTVHATGTRGLLALSKPKQLVKQPLASKTARHSPMVAATPEPLADSLIPPPPQHRGRKPRASPAAATPLATPTTTTATATASPSKPTKRSASHQALTRRHQPAPEPMKTPEPKEQPKAESHTSPRKRPVQHQRHNTAPPSPVVMLQKPPAGRGTRAGRRERHKSTPSNDAAQAAVVAAAQPATPVVLPLAPPAAITMPARKKDLQIPLSRSAPLEHMEALSDWDMPAAVTAMARPTITLNTQDPSWLISGPRTAPLDKSPHFPSYSPPTTPTPTRHARTPSYPNMLGGMFSFDDDADAIAVPSGTRSADVSPLRFARTQKAAAMAAALAAKKKQDDMWAASSFQTGPTLRDLPAPAL